MSTGALLSAPLIGSLLTSCETQVKKPSSNYKSVFFDENEFELLYELVDLILPKTDSPSGTEMGVDQMIDKILAEVYSSKDQKEYLQRYKMLEEYLIKTMNFGKQDDASKLEILKSLSKSDSSDLEWERKAFLEIRQQSIAYYLTTEEISKNYLNYLPIPGDYEACISVQDVDNKAWAL